MILAVSCNDDYLDRFPETEIGKENFFKSEEDLRIYVNSMYNFPGVWMYTGDAATDNATTTGNTELKTMMVSTPSPETILSGWDWEALRNINFFLENFDNNDLPEEILNHYEGLARFFRANFYMDKVKRYSDVPWYDYTIATDDEESLLKAQDSRAEVVEKIFEDYQFAADHVEEDQPAGAVNRWVVLSYMARNALYEGTFRKYHSELNLQGSADEFLSMASDAASQIMQSDNFDIYNTGDTSNDYGSLFTSTDLSGNSEVIFSRVFEDGLLNSGWWSFMFGNYEVSPSKDLLQAYLMNDGSFYSAQPGYETKLFVEEFVDRDPRLYQTYAYPGWELRSSVKNRKKAGRTVRRRRTVPASRRSGGRAVTRRVVAEQGVKRLAVVMAQTGRRELAGQDTEAPRIRLVHGRGNRTQPGFDFQHPSERRCGYLLGEFRRGDLSIPAQGADPRAARAPRGQGQ